MKYSKKRIIYFKGRVNYYFPVLNRFLLKEGVDVAENFREGFGVVKKGIKFNYVKRDGTYLLKEWVDIAYNFEEGFGEIRKNGKWYKVDKEGKLYEI